MTSQGFSPSLDDRVLSPRQIEAVSGGGGVNGAAYNDLIAKNHQLRDQRNAQLSAAQAAAPAATPQSPRGGMLNFRLNADGTIQGLEGLYGGGGGIGGVGGAGAGAGGAGGS
ncbi:MAG: hypothetical protein PW790_14400 [Parvibaculaceae bacterium]|nr:hypothetical protein [Parvibaculaceae bacterium]